MKLTLAQLIGEIITDTKIICDNCGWSWNKEDGGDDLYMCHKCDHNNMPQALENFKDGKVKEVFTPSPLQNLVNDYLFLVTLNFTHIEKTGKTPKDVDALTQMIRHAKSDVSKLKDLSKEQLEKNRNNILQRIHDMLTYIISRMKAHMRPEEYEKRRGRLNKLLTLYKDAASVKENYADGKVKGKSRPGRVKKSGASCKGSVTDLRRKAKNASGEKAKMYHWCANMKGGKK